MDDSEKLLAALSYVLWPLALIMLIIQETKPAKEQSKDLRHHAYNALGFAVGLFIIWFIISIVLWMPFMWYLSWMVSSVLWIVFLVLAIIFAVRAYNDQEVIVPIVTDILKKNVKNF